MTGQNDGPQNTIFLLDLMAGQMEDGNQQDRRKIFTEWKLDHQQGCWVPGSYQPQC